MILPFALLLAVQLTESSPSASKADEAALIANCNARKFETVVKVLTDGKPRSSRVKLCGKIGQSDADWVRTLQDAAAKVAANPKMTQSVKDQIIAALNAEIAKMAATAEAKLRPAPSIVATPAPPPALSPLLTARPPADRSPVEYSTLPPMPAPKRAVSSAVAAAASARPPLPAPRLTLRCLAATSFGGEMPCDMLERGMLLSVRADEDVPRGTSLRFLRRGDDRGAVELAALRRGQWQRFELPARVCQGVAGSRVEIQVVRSAGSTTQVVDTRGPFELRC